jgi:hypothetical protein
MREGEPQPAVKLLPWVESPEDFYFVPEGFTVGAIHFRQGSYVRRDNPRAAYVAHWHPGRLVPAAPDTAGP